VWCRVIFNNLVIERRDRCARAWRASTRDADADAFVSAHRFRNDLILKASRGPVAGRKASNPRRKRAANATAVRRVTPFGRGSLRLKLWYRMSCEVKSVSSYFHRRLCKSALAERPHFFCPGRNARGLAPKACVLDEIPKEPAIFVKYWSVCGLLGRSSLLFSKNTRPLLGDVFPAGDVLTTSPSSLSSIDFSSRKVPTLCEKLAEFLFFYVEDFLLNTCPNFPTKVDCFVETVKLALSTNRRKCNWDFQKIPPSATRLHKCTSLSLASFFLF